MNTLEQMKLVERFMKVAGQKVNYMPHFQSTQIANFRAALINEEIYGKKELVESIDADNLNGILDGLCDILYVVYGAIATYGIEMKEYEIFARRPGSTGRLMMKHEAHALVRSIGDSYQQFIRGIENGDMITISRGLHGIILEVNRIAQASNFDLHGAFVEVHNANMSKFCSSEEEAVNDIEIRIDEKSDKSDEYVGARVDSTEVDGTTYFIIKRAVDNKILKGTGFYEADLSKYH